VDEIGTEGRVRKNPAGRATATTVIATATATRIASQGERLDLIFVYLAATALTCPATTFSPVPLIQLSMTKILLGHEKFLVVRSTFVVQFFLSE
jgi:hypothetical protein